MNKRGLLAAVLMLATGFRVALGAELMVQYSAETGNPVAGEPVCVTGTFYFNTLVGAVTQLQWTPSGTMAQFFYTAPGTGTVTEYFANGTSETLTESTTFSASAGAGGPSDGISILSFAPPSVGSFEPDGAANYTPLTEAQFLASPDPWAQILPTVQVNADEGWFYNGQYFADNTAKLTISPVPTPPTLWLMLCGVGCLVFFGRKRLRV
jgi:hypothetical protein